MQHWANLLGAENVGASKFPNEIRYDHTLKHFSAILMQKANVELISWVRHYEQSIRA